MKVNIKINLSDQQVSALKNYLSEFQDRSVLKADIAEELKQYVYTYFEGGVPAINFYLEEEKWRQAEHIAESA